MAKKDLKDKNVEGSSNFSAKVTIKDIGISNENIISLVIREDIYSLLPRLELTFLDGGLFFENYPLEDYDDIVVQISKDKDKDAIVNNLKFALHDYETENLDDGNIQAVAIKITGILKVPDMLFPIYNRSFSKLSSIEAIGHCLSNTGLTIDKRITNKDIMTWLQLNKNNLDMINHIMEHSYVPNDALFCYTNRENTFVITTLLKELKKESKGLFFDQEKTLKDIPEEMVKANVMGNDTTKEQFYFNNFRFQNLSGTINKNIGYGVEYTYYGLDGEESKNIIDSNSHELTDLSMKNKNNVGKIVRRINYGMKYDEDNVHKEYLKARIQNKYIKDTFLFSPVTFYVNATNKLNLFDKLLVSFPAMTANFSSEQNINETFSGEYIIGSMVHQVGRGGVYKLLVNAFRNGINKNDIMEENEYLLSK